MWCPGCAHGARPGNWRNAVDLRHLPEGTHSLAPRPGSLARLAFQKWSAWQASHLQPFRLERNVSSNWTTRGWCPRPDLHRHCARFKSAVSALDYVGVTNVEFRMKNAE